MILITFCPGRPDSPGSPWPKKAKDEKNSLTRIFQNLYASGHSHRDGPASLITNIFHLFYSVTLHLTRHRKHFFSSSANIPETHIQIHISIKTNQKGKRRPDLLLSFYQISLQILPIVFGGCSLQENQNGVITINGGKREEKAEAYKNQNCNSWGTHSCMVSVTLIPAADDPGSP